MSLIYDVPRGTFHGPNNESIAILKERISKLNEDKSWLKKTVDSSLGSILGNQKLIEGQLGTLTFYSILALNGGDQKKAMEVISTLNNAAAAYAGVTIEGGNLKKGGKPGSVGK